MATTSPTRIDDELFDAAKAAGVLQSRSAAQQVNHWARIGRQLEASGRLSHRDIACVLAGTQSYDSLSAPDQAVVRADWDEQMTALRERLDFTEELAATGHSWVEVDAQGRTVHRPTAARPKPRKAGSTPPKPAATKRSRPPRAG